MEERKPKPESSSEPNASRPPLGLPLSVGVVVGVWIGLAWDNLPIGIGLGILLALVSRRVS